MSANERSNEGANSQERPTTEDWVRFWTEMRRLFGGAYASVVRQEAGGPVSAAMTLAEFQELRMRLYARARRGGPLGQLPAKAAARDLIEEWFSRDSQEKLQESLRKGLPAAVYDALVEWARASAQQQIASWQGRLRPRLEKVAWAKQADNSPRQGNSAALRAAYQLMNPKDWLDLFKATFEVSDIRLGYNRFLRSANSSLPFLDLPNRYQLPEASFKALEAGVLLGLTQVYEALGQLAMRLSSQVKLLKEVREALGFNIGFKLAAKLVGGPLPARSAPSPPVCS